VNYEILNSNFTLWVIGAVAVGLFILALDGIRQAIFDMRA
jgi:hypothetical protein